jgi:hypothetical protein
MLATSLTTDAGLLARGGSSPPLAAWHCSYSQRARNIRDAHCVGCCQADELHSCNWINYLRKPQRLNHRGLAMRPIRVKADCNELQK